MSRGRDLSSKVRAIWQMQVISKRPYTLFLRSPCGCACGDDQRSALGQKRTFNTNLLDGLRLRLSPLLYVYEVLIAAYSEKTIHAVEDRLQSWVSVNKPQDFVFYQGLIEKHNRARASVIYQAHCLDRISANLTEVCHQGRYVRANPLASL